MILPARTANSLNCLSHPRGQAQFPEIKTAIDALESRLAITEAEIAQMNEGLKAKKGQVKSLRKALAVFTPKLALPKKKQTALTGSAAYRA